MLPKAATPSSVPQRLRLRVTSKRGDHPYFEKVQKLWQQDFPESRVECNVSTASLVARGKLPDAQALAEFGRRHELFSLESPATKALAWTDGVKSTFLSLNHVIRRASGDAMDLTGTIFGILVLFGIGELIKGNWQRPPWYTAFWYAAGVYSKALIDKGMAEKAETQQR